jgi:tetratricopeptide (TPR) repeat protein
MLSEYYFSQQEMTQAMKALHRALDLQLEGSKNSSGTVNRTSSKDAAESVLSPQVLEQMNSMGMAQEQQGDYDQALMCYEKILLLTSRYLGDDHWEVAETLVKIGRVMEHQGNLAGGLDLYHAAHTIYQAAIKKATPDNDEEDEEAMNTRAATESVVRIANVLMSQKRWQEAVQFLRELPQAKQWLSWLGETDDESCTTDDSKSLDRSKRQAQAAPQPSVDQAIVFRELGRAYMGMGSLAKAKQCLLESARRLEGTDHEEDVFELLMHVEFCQKQGDTTARGNGRRRRSRSRSVSVSRTRSRSRHSRNNSNGSNSLEETARVVAAVLSSSTATVSSSGKDFRLGSLTPTQGQPRR